MKTLPRRPFEPPPPVPCRAVTASVLAVVGARPNFVKVAPVIAALEGSGGISVRVLHTGQHYDRALSGGFIERLGMREPDANLEVGSGTHAEQTAGVLIGIERDLLDHPADMVLVPGDVNSTVGAALAATKLHVAVAHIESGLRSRDWAMPEEVNRVVTDRIADLLLCTSEDAIENLAAEGITGDQVQLVGNTMIDSLFRLLEGVDRPGAAGDGTGSRRGTSCWSPCTARRWSTTRSCSGRRWRCSASWRLAAGGLPGPSADPGAPRGDGILRLAEKVTLAEPMDYTDFIGLEAEARLVVTDSGGVQEETSVLGTPCLTYRTTTERPVTVELGTNELVGVDPAALREAAERVLGADLPAEPPKIPLWDGHAGPRAAAAVEGYLSQNP